QEHAPSHPRILRLGARGVDTTVLKFDHGLYHIIAVGGAGSSGEPAFLSGIAVRSTPISAMTTTPARYEGFAKNSGSAQSRKLKVAITSPASASPAIRPEATSTPTFSIRALCAALEPAR